MFLNYKIKLLPKLFHSFMSEKLQDSKITKVYLPYLIHLKHREGLTMAELTKSVHLDKANTSRVLNELSEIGLVIIRDSDTDKRMKEIYLTDEGSRYVDIIASYMDEWEREIFMGVSDEEREILNAVIDKIIDNALNITKTDMEDMDA